MNRRSATTLFATLALAAGACAPQAPDHYQGYVEGDYVYVSSPFGGRLERLGVAEGAAVEAGALLFELDPAPESLRLAEARERVDQARARLADLEVGSRPSELAAVEARLDGARTALAHAEGDYRRRSELFEAGYTEAVTEEELDRFRADRDRRRADVAALEADLETARLGGREGALDAARREVAALEAALEERGWDVDQKRVDAPTAALVQDTIYHVGEYVPAGRPVVSLLPPENVRVRFYVPQALLSAVRVGARVEARADGREDAISATISFVSTNAEFTPPVIYSRESRAKLVFRVEAVPDDPGADLHPGQPLEVRLR